jgi:hypothetical protein
MNAFLHALRTGALAPVPGNALALHLMLQFCFANCGGPYTARFELGTCTLAFKVLPRSPLLAFLLHDGRLIGLLVPFSARVSRAFVAPSAGAAATGALQQLLSPCGCQAGHPLAMGNVRPTPCVCAASLLRACGESMTATGTHCFTGLPAKELSVPERRLLAMAWTWQRMAVSISFGGRRRAEK